MRDKLSHLWVDWKVVLGRAVSAQEAYLGGIVHVNGVCDGEISLGYLVHVYACEWRDLGRVIDYSRWASRRSRAMSRDGNLSRFTVTGLAALTVTFLFPPSSHHRSPI